MKTALRREMEAAGWRFVGVAIGFLALLVVGYFWGQHLEGRIDTIVIQRQHDHRQLHKLAVHEAREVQGNSKSVPSLELGATDAPSQANAPSVAHQFQEPVKHSPPRHHSPPAPSSGGSEPSPAPASSPSPAPTATQPTLSRPEHEQQQGGKGPQSSPLVPALEGVKGAASEVVSGANGAADEVVGGVQDTGCQLLGHCPTP